MEDLHYIYSPKNKRIVYKNVDRPEGFYRNSIHMHDHHELVLVSNHTEFCLVSNGTSTTVQGPCIIFNKAGSFHEVIHIKKNAYKSCVIFFHPQVLTDLPQKLLHKRKSSASDLTIISLSNQDIVSIYPLFDMIASRTFDEQLPLLLTIFASISIAERNGATILHQNAPSSYIFDVIHLLQHSQDDLSISSLSDRFHISPTKLKTDFKKITGLPVIAYKNKLRLERARILILEGHLSLAQIAYNCGFSDESYFIRAFKKQFSVTPAVYGKIMKESIKDQESCN